MKEEDLSITARFIRNVTYNYCALSTEVPLLFILCLKLRMCHSICSRVGVFPRYCTCKWSRFSEERRTKRTEIDWPCCIMYLFVTDISEHFKTYSCSVSARIWISDCFFTCVCNLPRLFFKTCFTLFLYATVCSRVDEEDAWRDNHGMSRWSLNPLQGTCCPEEGGHQVSSKSKHALEYSVKTSLEYGLPDCNTV